MSQDFRFLHLADIHLDSPLCGLERYEGAPVHALRTASRTALVNAVDLAIRERVSFVLIAGDIYDGDWRDYGTGLFFAREMSRLREAQIPVLIVRGNHDAASRITRQLRLPDNVHEFDVQRPETRTLPGLGVAVHGHSFPKREVTEDISAAYPDPVPDHFNIGLLHTCAGGYPGHESYAPCSTAALAAKGYDYWALGHVHRRTVLREQPWILFPGNLQGRHARETGPKGCTCVTMRDDAVVEVSHRVLDVVRWEVCEVDGSRSACAEDLVDACREAIAAVLAQAGDRPLAVRFAISAAGQVLKRLHSDAAYWRSEIRAAATDVAPDQVWVERIKVDTRPVIEPAEWADGPMRVLLDELQRLPEDPAALSEIGREFQELQLKLPAELRSGPEAISIQDPELLRELLSQAGQLLLARLGRNLGGKGSA